MPDINELLKYVKDKNITPLPVDNNIHSRFSDIPLDINDVHIAQDRNVDLSQIQAPYEVGEAIANSQSTSEKWLNDLGRLGTGAVSATVGGFAMIPAFFDAASSMELSAMYENGAVKWAEGLDEWGQEKFKNYYTQRQEEAYKEASIFKKMTYGEKFWGNSLLANAGFMIGAAVDEAIFSALTAVTSGGAAPLQAVETGWLAARLARRLAEAGTEVMGSGTNLIKNVYRGFTAEGEIAKQAMMSGLKNSRQLLTSAGYESSVEALQFQKEAYNQVLEKKANELGISKEELENNPLHEETLGRLKSGVNSVANGLWLMNLATVGLSNAIGATALFQLEKPILNMLERVNPLRAFMSAGVEDLAKTAGKEIGKDGVQFAAKNLSMAQKAFNIVKSPLSEGTEEFSQGLYQDVGKRYLEDKYNPNAIDMILNGIPLMADEIGKRLGDSSHSGWEEFASGFMSSLLGLPNVGRFVGKKENGNYGFKNDKEQPAWVGGIFQGIAENRQIQNERNENAALNNFLSDKNLAEMLDGKLSTDNITTASVKAFPMIMAAQKRLADGIKSGDKFEQNQAKHDLLAYAAIARDKIGQVENFKKDVLAQYDQHTAILQKGVTAESTQEEIQSVANLESIYQGNTTQEKIAEVNRKKKNTEIKLKDIEAGISRAKSFNLSPDLQDRMAVALSNGNNRVSEANSLLKALQTSLKLPNIQVSNLSSNELYELLDKHKVATSKHKKISDSLQKDKAEFDSLPDEIVAFEGESPRANEKKKAVKERVDNWTKELDAETARLEKELNKKVSEVDFTVESPLTQYREAIDKLQGDEKVQAESLFNDVQRAINQHKEAVKEYNLIMNNPEKAQKQEDEAKEKIQRQIDNKPELPENIEETEEEKSAKEKQLAEQESIKQKEQEEIAKLEGEKRAKKEKEIADRLESEKKAQEESDKKAEELKKQNRAEYQKNIDILDEIINKGKYYDIEVVENMNTDKFKNWGKWFDQIEKLKFMALAKLSNQRNSPYYSVQSITTIDRADNNNLRLNNINNSNKTQYELDLDTPVNEDEFEIVTAPFNTGENTKKVDKNGDPVVGKNPRLENIPNQKGTTIAVVRKGTNKIIGFINDRIFQYKDKNGKMIPFLKPNTRELNPEFNLAWIGMEGKQAEIQDQLNLLSTLTSGSLVKTIEGRLRFPKENAAINLTEIEQLFSNPQVASVSVFQRIYQNENILYQEWKYNRERKIWEAGEISDQDRVDANTLAITYNDGHISNISVNVSKENELKWFKSALNNLANKGTTSTSKVGGSVFFTINSDEISQTVVIEENKDGTRVAIKVLKGVKGEKETQVFEWTNIQEYLDLIKTFQGMKPEESLEAFKQFFNEKLKIASDKGKLPLVYKLYTVSFNDESFDKEIAEGKYIIPKMEGKLSVVNVEKADIAANEGQVSLIGEVKELIGKQVGTSNYSVENGLIFYNNLDGTVRPVLNPNRKSIIEAVEDDIKRRRKENPSVERGVLINYESGKTKEQLIDIVSKLKEGKITFDEIYEEFSNLPTSTLLEVKKAFNEGTLADKIQFGLDINELSEVQSKTRSKEEVIKSRQEALFEKQKAETALKDSEYKIVKKKELITGKVTETKVKRTVEEKAKYEDFYRKTIEDINKQIEEYDAELQSTETNLQPEQTTVEGEQNIPTDVGTNNVSPSNIEQQKADIERRRPEIVTRYTDSDVKANPDKIFVFGDNTQRTGTGGQAQIRNNPNAFGIATKLKPTNNADAFMSDNNLEANKNIIDSDIQKILSQNKPLVFPKDGFGTGLAKLKEKAPKTYEYLKQRLADEFYFDNDKGEINAKYDKELKALEENTPLAPKMPINKRTFETGQYVKYNDEVYIITKQNSNGTWQIYNPNLEGVNAKKSVSEDKLELVNGKAKIITYRDADYIVTPKNTIISLTSNKKVFEDEKNGNRINILNLAHNDSLFTDDFQDRFDIKDEEKTYTQQEIKDYVKANKENKTDEVRTELEKMKNWAEKNDGKLFTALNNLLNTFPKTQLSNKPSEITHQKAVEIFKEYFPNSALSLEDVSQVLGKLSFLPSSVVYGVYNGLVRLRQGGTLKDTPFFEGFRLVFNALITDKEKSQILEEARLKYFLGLSKDKKETILKEFQKTYSPKLNGEYVWQGKELENYYLETMLAREFANKATTNKPKSFIQRLFDKIRSWLGINKIDSLFNRILAKEFRDFPYSPKDNQGTIKTMLDVYSSESESGKDLMTSENAYRIANRIFSKMARDKMSFETALAATRKYYDDLAAIPGILNETKTSLEILSSSINEIDEFDERNEIGLQNIENLRKEVEDRKAILSFDPDTVSEEGNENEDIAIRDGENFSQSLRELGGEMSASKKFKEYLSTIMYVDDEFDLFGNAFSEEFKNMSETEQKKFYIPVDFILVYNTMLKLTAGKPKSEILGLNGTGLLNLMKDTDKQLLAVVNQMNVDIANPQEFDTTLDMILSNLEKQKVQGKIILHDNETGKFDMSDENAQGIENSQINKWASEYEMRHVGNIAETEELLKELKFPTSATALYKALNKYGFKVSRLYCQWCYGLKTGKYENDIIPKIATEYGLTTNNSILDKTNIEYIFDKIINRENENAKLIAKGLPGVETIFPNGDIYFGEKKNEGSRNKLKAVAFGNSIFDSSVKNLSYKNSENKTVYEIIARMQVGDFVNIINKITKANKQGEPTYDAIRKKILDLKNDNEEIEKLLKTEVGGKYPYLSFINSIYNLVQEGKDMENGEDMALKDVQDILIDLGKFIFHNNLENFVEKDDKGNYRQMEIGFLGGYRETSGEIIEDTYIEDEKSKSKAGTTFSSANEQEKTLALLGVWMKGWYNPIVAAGKSMQFIFKGNKVKRITPQKIEDTKNILMNWFDQEIHRIDRGIKGQVSKDIDKYEQKSQKFFENKAFVDSLANTDLKEIYSAFIEVDSKDANLVAAKLQEKKDFIEKYKTDKQFRDNIKEALFDFHNNLSLNFANKTIGTIGINLPQVLIDKKEKLVENDLNEGTENHRLMVNVLQEFYFDDLINSTAFYNTFIGDKAMSLKGYIDVNKRAGKHIAGGVSSETANRNIRAIGVKSIKQMLGIDEDFQIDKDWYSERENYPLKNKDKFEPTDTTDAESYQTVRANIDFYLKSNAKYTKEVHEIYEMINYGIEPSFDWWEKLDKNNAALQKRKMVYADFLQYIKTSVNTLTWQECSFWNSEALKAFANEAIRLNVEKLTPLQELAVIKTLTENNSANVAKFRTVLPSRKKMFGLLSFMLNNKIDYVYHDSASKSLQRRIRAKDFDKLEAKNAHYLNPTYWKEQVATDGVKMEVVDGTQKIQLIFSEQNGEIKVDIGQNTFDLEKVSDTYKQYLANRISMMYEKVLAELQNEDGTINIDELKAGFVKTLEKSGSTQQTIKFFKESNINLPHIVEKAESMFMSRVSKVLSHKKPGSALALASPKLYPIMRATTKIELSNGRTISENEVISTETYKKFSSEFTEGKNFAISRLRHGVKEGKHYYAEIILPANHPALAYMKDGFIPAEFAEMVGIRIPTQDKHSMLSMKVVDVIPAYKGSTVIVPLESILLSGEDFDIDKKYIYWYAGYQTVNGWKKYGDYKTFKELDEEVKQLASEENMSANDWKTQNIEQYDNMVKRMNESGKLEKTQTNKYELDNDLLDLEKVMVHNNGNNDIAYTPSSMDIVNQAVQSHILLVDKERLRCAEFYGMELAAFDTLPSSEKVEKIQKFVKEKGYINVYGNHSPLDKLTAYYNNDVGSENIGVWALSNVVMQTLIKESKYIKVENGAYMLHGIRINDIISSFLSSATDNDKEQHAAILQLDQEKCGIMFDLMWRQGLHPTVALGIIYDGNGGNNMDLGALMQLNPNLSETDAKFLNDLMQGDEQAMEKQKYLLKSSTNAAKYTMALTTLMSLNKGFKSTISDNQTIVEAIKTLKKGVVDKETGLTLPKPYDGWNIVQSDIHLKEEVDKFEKVYDELTPKVFLIRNEKLRNALEKMTASLKGMNYPTNRTKVYRDLISYVIVNIIKNNDSLVQNYAKIGGEEIFTTGLISKVKTILTPKVDNSLMKGLTAVKKVMKQGEFTGKTIDSVAMNTWLKAVRFVDEKMQNDYERFNRRPHALEEIKIAMENGKTVDEALVEIDTNKLMGTLAKLMYIQSVVKEGLQFKSGSVNSLISTPLFAQTNGLIDRLMDEKNFEEITGKSADQLMIDFIRNFVADESNKSFLPSLYKQEYFMEANEQGDTLGNARIELKNAGFNFDEKKKVIPAFGINYGKVKLVLNENSIKSMLNDEEFTPIYESIVTKGGKDVVGYRNDDIKSGEKIGNNMYYTGKKDAEFEADLIKQSLNEIKNQTLAEKIYASLPKKTESGNVLIKSVYQQAGIDYAKSVGGIFSLRVNNSDKHFGNPFSSVQSEIDKGLIATKDTKEGVEKYIDWVINSQDERAKWIREQLDKGILKGKPIIYYTDKPAKNSISPSNETQPSHANALDYLINNWESVINQSVEANKMVQPTSMSEITNHSGGALGADSMWDKIGRLFGVVNHKHYWANQKTPMGNVELTKQQLEEGIEHAKLAARELGRPFVDKYANLLGRNWFQIKNSTQVIAIAPIVYPNEKNSQGYVVKATRATVDGGTGYAVEMAIANGKEVNVFDTKTNQWYKWNGSIFVKSEVPILHKDFAGIGSRQDNGKMTDESIQAIRDVYEKTRNSLQEQNDVKVSAINFNDEQKSAINQAIEFIKNGNPKEWFVIEGKAGVGKTTIAEQIVRNFPNKNTSVAALSYKAKSVIRDEFRENGIKANFYSLAGLLGQKLNMETGEFERDEFSMTTPPIEMSDLILIDEASMINEQALELIMQTKPTNAKVIFLGDIGQLPPIRTEKNKYYKDKKALFGKKSPVFEGNNKAKLLTRIRQGEESPILPYADFYWENSQVSNPVEYPATNKKNVISSKGTLRFVDKFADIKDEVVNEFKQSVETNNPNHIKVVTYRNATRESINEYVHNSLFGNQNEFNKGELIIFNDSYDNIENSTESQISDITEVKTDENGLKYVDLTIIYEGKIKSFPVVLKESKEDYKKLISAKFANAKAKTGLDRKLAMKEAWAFKGKYANIDYGYAITSHKSQGSTYDIVVVDEKDIMSVSPISAKEKSESIYTALTRARNKVISISEKQKSPTEIANEIKVNQKSVAQVFENMDNMKEEEIEELLNKINEDRFIRSLPNEIEGFNTDKLIEIKKVFSNPEADYSEIEDWEGVTMEKLEIEYSNKNSRIMSDLIQVMPEGQTVNEFVDNLLKQNIILKDKKQLSIFDQEQTGLTEKDWNSLSEKEKDKIKECYL